MPQYLCGIAKPFAVLSIIRLTGFYLTGGDKVLQPLPSTDYVHGYILAESIVRHNIEDILQQYCRRINMRYLAFRSHSLFDSDDIDALVFHVGTGYPLFARLYTFIQHGGTRRVPDGIRIVGEHWERDDFAYIQVAELLRNASAGNSYCFLHIFLMISRNGDRLCSDDLPGNPRTLCWLSYTVLR